VQVGEQDAQGLTAVHHCLLAEDDGPKLEMLRFLAEAVSGGREGKGKDGWVPYLCCQTGITVVEGVFLGL
jgi:hypothetical protein